MIKSLEADVQGDLKVVNEVFIKTEKVLRQEPEGSRDGEVWARFKTGDEAAFVIIFQQHYDALTSYCYQFTRDEALIKDCIQDLFIYLRNKRATIGPTNNIRLYLLKCCKNRLMNYLKTASKTQRLEELEEKWFVPEISAEDNIISLQTKEIEEKRLKVAMKKLSLKEREIIYYFYFENLDYQSIAELLGYEHVKSARSLLYKALSKLKELF